MYVTRRLSEYQRNRSELKQPATEGPHSGVLIIQDEESKPTCCFGLCYWARLEGLPFPQNAKLTVNYSYTKNDVTMVYRVPVIFIPVLDQPLSSNRYYAIKRCGKHSGEASANAKEEDRVPCCFSFSYGPEAKAQQPDPYDIYQQFKIHLSKSLSHYFATSVAPHGVPRGGHTCTPTGSRAPYSFLDRPPLWVPPEFLKYWTVEYSTSEDYGLRDDATGIYTKLRSELPSDLNTSVVVGNWYVPFIFVNERDATDQLKSTTYYSMTLYQRWEEVYSCGNAFDENRKFVLVNVVVEREVVKLEGQEIGKKTRSVDENGVAWFEVEGKKIGLNSVVIKRMKWEEKRFGWKSEPQRAVVKRSERFDGGGSNWKSYRCYVLVESFVLSRMDDTLVLTFEFRHVDKLKSTWES